MPIPTRHPFPTSERPVAIIKDINSRTLFGALLKTHRIRRRLILRAAAELFEYDVAALSKIERGINFAPPKRSVSKWARLLQLTPAQTGVFVRLAAESRHEVSDELPSEQEVAALLPVFVRFKNPSKKRLKAFAAKVAATITGDHVLARFTRPV